MSQRRRLVFLGLSITSSWGNGHATTYRGLLAALAARGHDVLFLERDVPYYACARDLPAPPFCALGLYGSFEELVDRFAGAVREADAVILGSYVPEGARVAAWMLEAARGARVFYDLDTPETLAQLARGDHRYASPALIPRFDLVLSFTGGPTLERLVEEHGARRARPLYCAADPEEYRPEAAELRWDLGYLGTYAADRQATLSTLLLEPARCFPAGRFVVAGAQYPAEIAWPANVERADHVEPGLHRGFYNAQRFALNVTRRRMVEAGHSPSVRLFEAAACGVPVISDAWPGLEEIFEPGREILVASSPEEVLALLRELPESGRVAIGKRARARALGEHTAAHRAEELERHLGEI
jgi:spore maturation protein CgeB